MVLNLPGLNVLRGMGVFRNSPAEGEVLQNQGQKDIPKSDLVLATSTKAPGTAADDATVGTVAWLNVNNIKTDDANAADTQNLTTPLTDNSVRLVNAAGTIAGDDNSRTQVLIGNPPLSNYTEYGGENDLWGLTLTPTDINDSDFGIVYSAVGSVSTGHYLKMTNFGFAIPQGATIQGIVARIFIGQSAGVGYAYYAELKIYYLTV